MIVQRELFDARRDAAFGYLGHAIWAELQGRVLTAEHYGARANFLLREFR